MICLRQVLECWWPFSSASYCDIPLRGCLDFEAILDGSNANRSHMTDTYLKWKTWQILVTCRSVSGLWDSTLIGSRLRLSADPSICSHSWLIAWTRETYFGRTTSHKCWLSHLLRRNATVGMSVSRSIVYCHTQAFWSKLSALGPDELCCLA